MEMWRSTMAAILILLFLQISFSEACVSIFNAGSVKAYDRYFSGSKSRHLVSLDDAHGRRILKVEQGARIWQMREVNDTHIEQTSDEGVDFLQRGPRKFCASQEEYANQAPEARDSKCRLVRCYVSDSTVCPQVSKSPYVVPENERCQWLPRGNTTMSYCFKYGVGDIMRFCCYLWRFHRCGTVE